MIALTVEGKLSLESLDKRGLRSNCGNVTPQVNVFFVIIQ